MTTWGVNPVARGQLVRDLLTSTIPLSISLVWDMKNAALVSRISNRNTVTLSNITRNLLAGECLFEAC